MYKINKTLLFFNENYNNNYKNNNIEIIKIIKIKKKKIAK